MIYCSISQDKNKSLGRHLVSISPLVTILLLCLFITPTIAADRYEKAINLWVSQLKSEKDERKRVEAARNLGAHNTPKTLSALAQALTEDASPKVRQQAASSLWKHSPDIDAAKSALQSGLGDSSPAVRVRSSWALQNAGTKPQTLIAPRKSALADPDSSNSTRFWAAYGLVGFESPTSLIEPILAYTKSQVRSKAATRALKKLVALKDRSIIPAMETVVRDFHKGNPIILEGMQQFNPQPKQLVELILIQFTFNNIELERSALGLLRKHGKKQSEVSLWLPIAAGYLGGNDDTARYFALDAISNAEGHAVDAVPEIIKLVRNSNDPRTKERAVEAIGEIGDRNNPFPEATKIMVADQCIGLLSKVIRTDKDRSTRLRAVRALDKLKSDPDQVVPLFIIVAKADRDSIVRTAALSAIGARGADSKSVLEDLEVLTKDPDRAVSQSAQDAITMISRGSNRAAETLQPEQTRQDKNQQAALAKLRESGVRFNENEFMLALSNNDIEKVRAYLDSGVSANYQFQGTHQRPALNEVFTRATGYFMQGQPIPQKLKDTAKLLIDRGADPNLTDKMGNSALIIAAMACDAETLQILLDGGADLNQQSKAGLTPLEYAFMLGNPGAETLLEAGARISQEKADTYLQSYGKNPKAVELIKRSVQK